MYVSACEQVHVSSDRPFGVFSKWIICHSSFLNNRKRASGNPPTPCLYLPCLLQITMSAPRTSTCVGPKASARILLGASPVNASGDSHWTRVVPAVKVSTALSSIQLVCPSEGPVWLSTPSSSSSMWYHTWTRGTPTWRQEGFTWFAQVPYLSNPTFCSHASLCR